jgi:hypothetical protein
MLNNGRKIVLIHGYSDNGASFRAWAQKLQARGADPSQVSICNYVSLNNEVTISDIGEGLDRLFASMGWADDEPFDAIVHSTGMLVIRAWLAASSKRRVRLKHLIGLAPATWGSPLASLGRSFLSAIVRGNHQFGPDFLNAGDRVLDGLELGSEFTWDLAHVDLLGDHPTFTTAPDSPYAAVFIGNTSYSGIRELVNRPATDGTVRWSGCALNTRKIIVDLRQGSTSALRATISPWANDRLDIPMFPVEGKNHTTLLEQPEEDLADRVVQFLAVSSPDSYQAWTSQVAQWSSPALAKMKTDKDGPNDGWQQFVVRVSDEFGGPVPDYVVDLFRQDPTGKEDSQLNHSDLASFDLDVHPYQADQSFRCFHVRLPLNSVAGAQGGLWLRLTASSGTAFIAYQGYSPGMATVTDVTPVILDISHLNEKSDSLFYPFTTTLVEILLNREPLPFQGQTQLMTLQPWMDATPPAGSGN